MKGKESMKCNVCGGNLIPNNEGLMVCEFCGNVYHDQSVSKELENQLRSKSKNESIKMLELAEENRKRGDYDEAYYAYQGYLENNPTDARGYWGKVLSKYGILFEEEQIGTRLVQKPTLNRMNECSILDDEDYQKAILFSNEGQKSEYVATATEINQIQKNYMSFILKEKPYDVFICFKAQEDEDGRTTRDSSIAYEIYERLNSLGNLNIFFSRITLQEKMAGSMYEPYIYSALNTAKVMILVGTSPEHVGSQWVKNEWTRFHAQMKNDPSKVIIPVVQGMKLSQMPELIPLGYGLEYKGEETLAELTEGILNITGKGRVLDEDDDKKALVILKDQLKTKCDNKDFKAVRQIANKILDIDAKCGEAYYYLLLAEYKVEKGTMLADLDGKWLESSYYKYAVRFGDETIKNRLEAIEQRYEMRKENEYEQAELERKQLELEKYFLKAKKLMEQYAYKDAKQILISNAYRHPEAPKCLEICNLAIEAQERIGDKNTYMSRKLKEKNPYLFGKWQKAKADRENLNPPSVGMQESMIAIIVSVIGFILTGVLAENHPYISIVIATIAIVISASTCQIYLVSGLSIPLSIFSMLLEWGAGRGQNKGIGSMLIAMVLVYITVKGIIAGIRWKSYVENDKANQAVFAEVKEFVRREHQELIQKYRPVLGEEFIKKFCPTELL